MTWTVEGRWEPTNQNQRTEYITYDGGKTWTVRTFAEYTDGSEEMLSAGPIDDVGARRAWKAALARGWKPSPNNPAEEPAFLQ